MHPIEKAFSSDGVSRLPEEHIDTIVVSNLVDLGRLTALRFIHWTIHHPQGVVSLPTGKTPEFFIEWVKFYRKRWNDQRSHLSECGFTDDEIDHGFSCEGLRFVQIDEFFPMNPAQTNSFSHYIDRFYFGDFGIRRDKALTLDPQAELGVDLDDLFPEGRVDYLLQFQDDQSLSAVQRRQKAFLLELNESCDAYERRIRDMGGIGFFLGGIGPDGHVAFNVRGSSHFSTTRLCPVNYETRAASAADLGGIQGEKLVLTIGLGTIAFDRDALMIIMAAGNAKAEIVRRAIEWPSHSDRPASVLHGLPNARFYLTPGAASRLEGRTHRRLSTMETIDPSTQHEILCSAALKMRTPLESASCDTLTSAAATKILRSRLQITRTDQLPPLLEQSKTRLEEALAVGRAWATDRRTLHTGPHHDDLILGIFPVVKRELDASTEHGHVTVLTSGFTSVTNGFFLKRVTTAREWLAGSLPDFRTFSGAKRDAACRHYLEAERRGDAVGKSQAVGEHLVREVIAACDLNSWSGVRKAMDEIAEEIGASYAGKKDRPVVQRLKGALREFEEELTWMAHGMDIARISHLRLGFYQGDIFNQDPSPSDCDRVLQLLEDVQPTRISLALDPEGSGPDTHYKCLLAISEALSHFVARHPDRDVEVLGYRNVWNRYAAWEADAIFLMSSDEMQVIDRTFKIYYFSQVEASFPSPDYNGPFSELAIQIWKTQKWELEQLLGKTPELVEAQGAIFLRILTPEELIAYAQERRTATQGL